MLRGANCVTGAAIATLANVKVVASSSDGFVYISASQIFGLQRLEVLDRLRAGRMVEVMPHPVAERTAVYERRLQSEMQAHLGREIDDPLTDLGLFFLLGTGVSLTGHHAELADTGHERFVGITPFLRGFIGERGEDKCGH
jgi:hypothetical protein